MSEHSGFETVKLLERGGTGHIVMDFTKGEPLIVWLRYHSEIDQEQLLQWIYEIAAQMELYHRSSGQKCYRYLNPYSIIVTDEGHLSLLDLEAESNQDILKNMQQRTIRTYFSPQDGRRRSKKELDVYAYGKTIQFLLAQTEVSPKLSKSREHKLSKIIKSCVEYNGKQSYSDFHTILEYLPKQSKKSQQSKRKIRKKPYGIVVSALVCAIVLAVGGYAIWKGLWLHRPSLDSNNQSTYHSNQENSIEDTTIAKDQQKTSADKAGTPEDQLALEMGLTQFVDLGNYEKSLTYFQQIKGLKEPAKNYRILGEYMLGKERSYENDTIMNALKELEKWVTDQNVSNWMKHYEAWIRVYAMQDNPTAREKILELSNQLESSVAWGEEAGELQMEVRYAVAVAYSETGKEKEAIEIYENLLKKEDEYQNMEGVYSRLAMLYKENEEEQKAVECCREGMKKYPNSKELMIDYMTLLCGDQALDRVQCAEEIKKCLDANQEIQKEERFQTLQKEYEIVIEEGGNVCVGK